MTNLDAVQLIALAATLGWASGLRLYLTVLLVGIAGHWGWVALPPGLQVLASPLVMACAAALAFIEFLADKIPLVDSAWDALHTLIRIPAGAALVTGLVSGWAGDGGQAWGIMAALLGGGLAAAAHTAKASTVSQRRRVIPASMRRYRRIDVSAQILTCDSAVIWRGLARR